MTQDEALRWLDSLESLGIQPGLRRITALLARLGDPQRDFRSVLIAGTNGKGSVAAFTASILDQAGLAPGLYTSPHLVRFEERIRIAGQPIGGPELAALTGEVEQAVAALRRDGGAPPTYFEATTALAFLHFSRRRVPIAVLEVGMGGRYDATNVVTPVACAITPIALDHTQWLGETLAEIAHQKAGILKPGVPAVVARQEPEVLALLRREAAATGSPLQETARCAVRTHTLLADPPVFDLETPRGGRYEALAPALRGAHQIDNATVAVLLAEIVGAQDKDAIERGLRAACWPGRLELVPAHPAGSGPALLLDGAHNPAGCRVLADYLAAHQAARTRRVLVCALMRDKAMEEMLGALRPLFGQVIATTLAVARARDPEEVARAARDQGFEALMIGDPGAALERAEALAGPGGLVVVCGSLYLVGEIRKRLRLA